MELVPLLVALGIGGVLVEIVRWFLNRGKVKTDDATAIRNELRIELERYGNTVAKLEQRVEQLECQLDKTERERDEIYRKHEVYKIELHRMLAIDYIGHMVDGILIQRVLDLDKRVVDDNL